jgi:hypothetical protein
MKKFGKSRGKVGIRELKGFIVGVVITFMLSGTVLMANPVMQQLIFGVQVSLDGRVVQFDADSQPFVIDGRTFLPVRAIADMVGLNVDFDGATNTVLLTTGGGATVQQPVPTPQPAAATLLTDTFFDGDTERQNWNDHVGHLRRTAISPSVRMGGRDFANAVEMMPPSSRGEVVFASHNLGGNFSRLSGTMGRIDGTNPNRDMTVIISGDGRTLGTFTIGTYTQPIDFNIDVTGVTTLRIVASQDGTAGSGRPRVGIVGTLN